MAVNTDNLDEVIAAMAKMEKAVDLEIIREARKRFRAIMRKLVPTVKKDSPKDTGELVKSIKVQGRSRRGISSVKIKWLVAYAGPLNFKKGQSAEKFATELWQQRKESLDQQGSTVVRQVFKEVLERHGVKVENT